MKRIVLLLMLGLFVLSACEKAKPEIEIPMPTEPPNMENMQPDTPFPAS